MGALGKTDSILAGGEWRRQTVETLHAFT